MEAESKKLGEGEGRLWPGALQWNSEIQRRWGLCTLQFWLLRFHEWYEREATFDRLVELMEELGIGSYAAYELSGQFDVLLRAWVPEHVANRLEDHLNETFPLEDSRQFTVARIVRHWPWADESSYEPAQCDPAQLAEEVTVEAVEAANRISDQGHLQVAEEPWPGDLRKVERLMELGAITDLGSTVGIRMFIRLRGKGWIDSRDWSKLIAFAALTLDQLTRDESAARNHEQGFALDDVSLYSCNDRSLLILCRIPYHGWHDLREHLLEPLAAMGGVTQTTTLPALSRSFVRSRDRLILDREVEGKLGRESGPEDPGGSAAGAGGPWPSPPPVPPGVRDYLERPVDRDLRDYLERPEDRDFEAKGSAFAPLEQWLRLAKDAPEDDALHESGAFFRNTIGKTVVAMLNSEGGSLLIGVLERDKFAQQSSKLLERIADLPEAGRYYVLGLQDPVFRRKDWDGFELKFNRMLKECIDGEIADLVRITRDWHGGRSLALVQVTYPGMSHGFYLRGEGERRHFYVRRGGSSDELHGGKVLEYIERARQREAESGGSA
jgi:hypothetical protein